MNQVTNSFNSGLRSFIDFLPALIGGILLILVAWLVAVLVRKAISKGLRAVNLDKKLIDWGAAESEEQAGNTIDTLATVFYYLVWVLFLPGIFQAFGLSSIAAPFTNMIQTALNYVPNLIGAAVILILGFIAARFVKNLVYNLAKTLNVDRWMNKLTGDGSRPVTTSQKDTLASVLANIVYVLILIPIITVALETLNIRSISEPIINVLNILLSAIPNILVAVILLGVGIAIAKFVGDLITSLLRGTGINSITRGVKFDLADAIGKLVAVLIGLFFFVEALNALNLAVLNTIGAAIIAYLPNILFALIIIGLAIVGGQLLANMVTRATGSSFTGKLLEVILLVFGTFMALSQLRLATSIVNAAFIFIIGGLAVAFAIAFGVGGRDFARKQLQKLDNKMDKEKGKNDQPPHADLERKMKSAGKSAVEETETPRSNEPNSRTMGARPETGVSPEERETRSRLDRSEVEGKFSPTQTDSPNEPNVNYPSTDATDDRL